MGPFSLSDAVVFHDKLNPAIWDDDMMMRPEVREHLLAMAADFQEYLGIDDLNLVDITVSGSNAAFSYTPHSDIDLHLVAEIPPEQTDLYREFFDAKKNLYNTTHDLKIRGFDVELYVQDSQNPVESMGIFSVMYDKWLSLPRPVKPTIDDLSVRSKVESMYTMISQALASQDSEEMRSTWDKLRNMRKAGLDAGGEFSVENLAFKVLRTQGWVRKLYDGIMAADDRELSLEHIEEMLEEMIGE